jgi:hypothetical protein
MIGSLLFLLLGSILGILLLNVFSKGLKIEERIIWGIPIGIMLFTFWTFLWAVVITNQHLGIFISSLTILIVCVDRILRNQTWKIFTNELLRSVQLIKKDEIIAWGIVLAPTIIYNLITIPNLLHFQDGNLVAGWINIWGDWAVHLRNSTFFANQTSITLENPIYSGSTFYYPYLSSYLSAILQQLGLSIDLSMTLPTMILSMTLPPVLYIFGRRITGRKSSGIIFTYIVLLSGGIGGIVKLITDLTKGNFFWEKNAYSPLLYTDIRDASGSYSNTGVWFMNFVISEFFPQRAFLSAIHIALFVIYMHRTVTYEFLKVYKTKRTMYLNSYAIFASALFGILPIIHTHSFIALGILLPIATFYLFAQKLIKNKSISNKYYFQDFIKFSSSLFLPATIIGFSILFVFVFDFKSSQVFIHSISWWVPNQDATVNPILYWWNNAGLFIVLGFISYISGKAFRPYFFGALVIFIAANFISFQPWHYDNLKLLTYWYIIWALPISYFLVSLKKKLLFFKIVLFILLTISGTADIISLSISTRSGITLSSSTEYEYSQIVNEFTEKDALILSATNHDNPISVSSGRRLFLGYEGWLWSYGIDTSIRRQEVNEIYSGSQYGFELVQREGIDYISIGPNEIVQYKPDLSRLTELYPIAIEHGEYKLLKVKE